MAGRPKYLSFNDSVIIFKDWHTNIGVFSLKKMLDFASLTLWPELAQYLSRILLRLSVFLLSACIKISESSAKRRWDTSGASLQTRMPSISPLDSAPFSNLESPRLQIKIDKEIEDLLDVFPELG